MISLEVQLSHLYIRRNKIQQYSTVLTTNNYLLDIVKLL